MTMRRGAKTGRSYLSFVPLAILAFFLVLAFMYQGGIEARATVGEVAPDFKLLGLNGEEASLSDFRGRPVVVNFWTTWCTECRTEVPELERLHQRRGDSVVVLGVNMREPESVIRPFLDELGATYPVLLDRDKKVAKAYRVTGVPETWIVSAEGVALHRFIGPVSAAQLEQALNVTSGEATTGKGGA